MGDLERSFLRASSRVGLHHSGAKKGKGSQIAVIGLGDEALEGENIDALGVRQAAL